VKEYQIILDVWEGSLDIEEDVLLNAGVVGLFPRINSMAGGHHDDENFAVQWEQARPFAVRAPYFVYNPWVLGKANFEYLAKVIPRDAQSVMLDIEVRYSGYSSSKYAEEFGVFFELCKKNWTSFIYTGMWFYPFLDYWPDADYCIARYPYSLYPKQEEVWTWEQLREELDDMRWYPGLAPHTRTGVVPADRIRLWQCSGDRLILPGTKNRAMDIIVYNGSLGSLVSWLGGTGSNGPAQVYTMEEKVSLLWKAHPELWV